MAKYNKTLHLIATKLGLGDDDKVLGKAAEFERLLQTRSIAGSNMTDTSKVVICLDLAAGWFGADLDQKTAIKYSGLKPSMYVNSRKMVQKLLELDSEKLTTSVLCAALHCTGVQALADDILEEYQKQARMEIDLNLPQYVCMAVYHACRIKKVKVSKVKINEKSRLKPAQWNKLDVDWSKFVDELFAGPKKKRGRPPKNPQANVESEPMDVDLPLKDDTEPQIEPYDDWKRRILEEAYKELRDLEKIDTQKEELIEKQKTPRRYKELRDLEKNDTQKEELMEKQKMPRRYKELRDLEKNDTQKEELMEKQKTPRRYKELRDLEKNESQKEELTEKQKTPRRYKELLDLEIIDTQKEELIEKQKTPRRSPRKTPQKYSPYKSPAKVKGVRLLFPV